jgi:hypothetical protein
MFKVNEGRPNVADHLVNRDIDWSSTRRSGVIPLPTIQP